MVQIRLVGTLAEVLKAEEQLAKQFIILQRGDFYPNKRSDFGRLYLTCKLSEKNKQGEKQ